MNKWAIMPILIAVTLISVPKDSIIRPDTQHIITEIMSHKILLSLLIPVLIVCSSCDESGGRDQAVLGGDLLITNARIIDGSGAEAYEGEILMSDGRIVEVIAGSKRDRHVQAGRVIDAEGKIVTPGFIDLHSHGNAPETPRFDNFLAMGVTTITLGQDGSSPSVDQMSVRMDRVDEEGTGPNIIYFAGHNSLRRVVDAPRSGNLDDELLAEMQELLRNALEEGAFGLSTGLEYDHGSFSDLSELIALAEPVAEADAIVMSHMRNEDEEFVAESLAELIQQGRGSGARVHASHLKVVFGNDPAKAGELLELMSRARAEGVMVTADVYPYTASFTGIAIVFPDWALPPNNFDDVVSNRRGELEEYLRNRVNRRNGPEATLIGTAPWAGMTLAEVAAEVGKPFEDVLIDDIGPNGASAAYFVMNEEVMKRLLQDPFVMVSSDGSPTMRHPRGYGSFAKIIRQFVMDEDLFTLEEAIHKMSGLPAETVGLSDPGKVDIPRGLLREGYAADLLIFDPEQVTDNATFEEPHRLAGGFDWVFVNGVAVIEDGEVNARLPGGVIRRR
jgi:N-acyl-D-amino-acid deacylase